MSLFLYLAGKRDGFGSGIIVDPSTDIHHGAGYYQGHWKNNCRLVYMHALLDLCRFVSRCLAFVDLLTSLDQQRLLSSFAIRFEWACRVL